MSPSDPPVVPVVPVRIALPSVAAMLLALSACGLLGGEPAPDKPADKAAVNCAEQCPCECTCDDKAAKGDLPDKDTPYGMVFAGNVRVSEGTLPLSSIKSRVATERLALRECYVPALEKNPELKGEVDVQFTVSGGTGKIIAAIVRESTLNDKEVESCVTKKVKGWTFPKTEDGKETVVRFTAAMFAASL